MPRLATFVSILIGTMLITGPDWSLGADAKIISFPQSLSKQCRDGRAKIYDECGDQLALFEAAAKRAANENKVLLVSYGAEWCIWCHVFDQYVHGGKTRFEYTFAAPEEPDQKYSATLYEREKRNVTAQASELRTFVANSFVLVHIESRYAPNGEAVLQRTGADRYEDGWIPFIFSVDRNGEFAAMIDYRRVQIRRDTDDWYRGYDRARLQEHLSELHQAAIAQGRN